MHLTTACAHRTSARAVAALAGPCVLLYPSQAFGLTLGEAVQTVTETPLAMFGLGFVFGATVGGVAAGISERSARVRLENELQDAISAATRAEGAAHRAQAALAAYTQQETRAQADSATAATPAPPMQQEGPAPQPQRAQAAQAPMAAPAAATSSSLSDTSDLARRSKPATRGVRAILQERLGASIFDDDLPVIDRGATRNGQTSTATVAKPTPVSQPAQATSAERTTVIPRTARGAGDTSAAGPAVRSFDPAARAALINRRVPRFDESLFPDISAEVTQSEDAFESAMKAMERSLPHTAATEDATTASQPPAPQQEEGAVVDAQSYVDNLIREEMEINRNGAGRRYSRSKLTMFEGTGDLSAARHKSTYHAQHLARATKEA